MQDSFAPDELTRLLERIAAEPRFQLREPGPIERARAAVMELLAKAFGWLGDLFGFGGGTLEVGAWIAGAIALALAVWLVSHALRGLRSGGPRRPRGDGGLRELERAQSGLRSGDELLELAAKAEAAGELEAAVRHLFAAGLRVLDESRRMRRRPEWTAGEIALALPPGSARQSFRRLARAYVELEYGARPVPQQAPAEMRAALVELRPALGGPR